MALYHSPKIVTNGLVFAYDMSNTKKSWKGAPTTNLLIPEFNNWSNTALVTTLNEVSPCGDLVYSITDNSNTSYLARSRNTTVPNDSNTYTISIFVKKTYGASSARLGFNSGFIGGSSPVQLNQRFNSDTGVGTGTTEDLGSWWRWQFQLTNNSTGNTTLYCEFYPATGFYDSGDNSAALGTAIVSGIQLEQNSFATPFVNGTRSNTQSIIDLTGKNTITANNLTYNSDGTFSLNGLSDYITTGPISGLGSASTSFSMSVWVYATGTSGNIISMSSTNPSGSWNEPPIRATGQQFQAHVYPSTYLSYSYVLNTWYNLVLVYNAVNTTQYFYVNGALVGSTSGITYSASGTSNYLFFGQSNPGANNAGMFAGKIGAVQIYTNKALSESEIRQNFNALRRRFGI